MSLLVKSEPVVTDQSHQQLRRDVSLAAQSIAPNWPIRTFISRSPLSGFEHLPFHEAIRRAKHLLGGEGYLSLAEYRRYWTLGRIGREDLQWALNKVGPSSILGSSIQAGTTRIQADEVLLLHLIHGIEKIDEATFAWKVRNEQVLAQFQCDVSPANRARLLASSHGNGSAPPILLALWQAIGAKLSGLSADTPISSTVLHRTGWSSLQTVAELTDQLTGSRVLQTVNDEMIKWLTAFTDEGLGDWTMPHRELGFYGAWRTLAQHDTSAWFLGIRNFSEKLRALPDRAEDALLHLFHRLGVSDLERIDYCSRHLAHLHGWSGYIRWKDQQPDQRNPIDPIQYLAVRLFYEAELGVSTTSNKLGERATLPDLRDALLRRSADTGRPHHTIFETDSGCQVGDAWRLFILAQHVPLTLIDIHMLCEGDLRTLLQWLDSMPPDTHHPIWQEAYERRYRQDLLGRLHRFRTDPAPASQQPRPLAQAVFCIDVRSERLRRHLEAQGAYETIGFAGFFGVPLSYRSLDREEDQSLCPVLIKPKTSVFEMPRSDRSVASEAHVRGSYWKGISKHLFHRLKANPLASYMLVDVMGALFAFVLTGRTVLPALFRRLTSRVQRWFIPEVPTTIPIQTQHYSASAELQREPDKQALPYGFSVQEQAMVTENSLRLMALTSNFARLVLICGHGSETENNPYAAAYDCGACGGNHGGPNARVLARLANSPETRSALRDRGISIPDDTVFVAAEHNTTTDQVTFFDLEDLPSSHREDWLQLARDLERAGALTAAERCRKLPGASRFATMQLATEHVKARSLDWAQTRPEWGLSGNAAFIIGRQALTRGLDLDGRVFLHNYDANADESGKLLETIMTAPLVVGEWINLQYYFSAVDGWIYGSGSKVLHNVVGGIGVMLGRHSDLQTGLPMQSVRGEDRLYHEPMRLLTIIEATPERLSQIICRHQVLQQFFDHQWVHLVAMNPGDGEFQQYCPGGQWIPVPAPALTEKQR